MTEPILGTAQLSSDYGLVRRRSEPADFSEAVSFLRAAVEAGVTVLDTAPVYENAESIIGSAGVRVAIHTKLHPSMSPIASVTASLARLQRDKVELVYLHDPTVLTSRDESYLDQAASMLGTRFDHLGASVYEVPEFRAALLDPRISAIQVPLSVADRRFSGELLSEAAARGVRVYARSVLLQGVLTASSDSLPPATSHLTSVVRELAQLASASNASAYELALGWVKSRPDLAGLVLGVDNLKDLRAFLTAMRADLLPESVLSQLDLMELPPWEQVDPRRWKLA